MRLLLPALFLVASSAMAQEHQYTPLEASLIRDNICAKPTVQAQLVAFYNNHPQMKSAHGDLVKVSNSSTTHVSVMNEDLTCSGDYTFADGTTSHMGIGVPYDFRQP